MKSVKISNQTWKRMMRIKLDYGYASVDEIIENLLKIVPATELKKG